MLANIKKKLKKANCTFISLESRRTYEDLPIDNMYIGGSEAYKGHRGLNIFKGSKGSNG